MINDAARLTERLEHRSGPVLLDGGLATELERNGYELADALWSARILCDEPDAICRVHRAYVDAGADCIVSASYQASVPGLLLAGYSEEESEELLRLSVTLARQAAGEREPVPGNQAVVAAGIGPYGAWLADGSEYSGDYGVGSETLRGFHQPRWNLLAEESSLMACETIPSLQEAEVLIELLRESPGVSAWISFSCRDGTLVSDGTPLAECAALCAAEERIIAVGVNCTPPRFIDSLVEEARRGAPDLPVVVYPNSGEVWNPQARGWTGSAEAIDFARAAVGWYERGAEIIGGCCRTHPGHIRELARVFPDRSGDRRPAV